MTHRASTMRLIHTADWHLGRVLHGVHLTEDQAHVLNQLVELAAEVHPHAIIVSGDLYDRAVPPVEAVQLLSDTLQQLVRGLGVPVVLIAGNHDSAKRLSFGSELLAQRGLYVVGPLAAQQPVVTLHTDHQKLVVLPIPYAEPALAREQLDDPSVHDHAAAMAALCQRARAAAPASALTVVVAHAFVAGGAQSESERPLSVGGTGSVPAAAFAGFTYVALGHLHRPQAVAPPVSHGSTGAVSCANDASATPTDGTQLTLQAAEAASFNAHYAGSLLPYSFAEADHQKSVAVVEISAPAREGSSCAAPRPSVRVELVPLSPRHSVRCLRGHLADILAAGKADAHADDYLEVTLTDRGAIYDAMGQLREVYPNTLSLRRAELEGAVEHVPARDHRTMTEHELFADFFRQVTGDELSAAEDAALVETLEALHRRDREAS
jgi:exonuclease SbcD